MLGRIPFYIFEKWVFSFHFATVTKRRALFQSLPSAIQPEMRKVIVFTILRCVTVKTFQRVTWGGCKCSIWIITKRKLVYMIMLVTKVHLHHFLTVLSNLDSSSCSFRTCARSPCLQLPISFYKLCKCAFVLISIYIIIFFYLQNNKSSSWLFISPVNSVAKLNKCSPWLHWTVLMQSITSEDLDGWITKVYFAVHHMLCVGSIYIFEIAVFETSVLEY